MKKCTACLSVKPVAEFYKNSRAVGDGYRTQCKPCTKAKDAEWRGNNREKKREAGRTWYDQNKEYRSEYHRKWYAENGESKRAQNAKWLAENAERKRETNRAWLAANKEHQAAANAEWARKNPERMAANARGRANRRRARLVSAPTVPFSTDELEARWDYYGRKCWICGVAAEATDHVKPISKGGAHMLCNLRPICLPCNSSKHNKWPFRLELAA